MNTIVYGNTPSTIYSNGSQDNHPFSYSNIEGGQAGLILTSNDITVNWLDGNLDTNPLFSNPGTDWSLQSGSPAIDAGNPNAFYNDSDGSQNDMGYTGGSGIYIPSADVNFGNIGVGSSRDKNFIIYNTKSDDITIDSFSSSDDQFTVNVASFPFTIPGLSRSNTLALNFNGVK